MFSLVANIIGIALMTSILPKKNSNDWDPFESEEKEAKVRNAYTSFLPLFIYH